VEQRAVAFCECPPYRDGMSNRIELLSLKKLLSEADLILSTTEVQRTAPPGAVNCSAPL